MNKAVFLLSALVCANPALNIATSSKETVKARTFKAVTWNSDDFRLPFKNRIYNALLWSSLGTISSTVTYRTMHDIYYKKKPVDPQPMLGDKILGTILCWLMVTGNLFELYSSHK